MVVALYTYSMVFLLLRHVTKFLLMKRDAILSFNLTVHACTQYINALLVSHVSIVGGSSFLNITLRISKMIVINILNKWANFQNNNLWFYIRSLAKNPTTYLNCLSVEVLSLVWNTVEKMLLGHHLHHRLWSSSGSQYRLQPKVKSLLRWYLEESLLW